MLPPPAEEADVPEADSAPGLPSLSQGHHQLKCPLSVAPSEEPRMCPGELKTFIPKVFGHLKNYFLFIN